MFESPRAHHSSVLFKDQVERLSVGRIETYSVNPTVRKYHFEEFGSFRVILLNVPD